MNNQCPTQHLHTKQPEGYLAWHYWATRKARRHKQIICPGCGRYEIWKRREKGEQDYGGVTILVSPAYQSEWPEELREVPR